MNSRLLAGILCAIAFFGVLGLFLISSHSAPVVNTSANEIPADNAPRNGRSTFKKIMIPQPTGDVEVDRANVAKAMEEARLVQQRTVQRAAAIQRAKNNAWKGTTLSVKPTETHDNTIALHQSVCRAFSADPAAPVARTNAIRAFTGKFSSSLQCTGYRGTVESAMPNDQGWKVVVGVSPLLEGRAPIVYTGFTIIEEWQIGKDGSLQNLSCTPKPETESLFFD